MNTLEYLLRYIGDEKLQEVNMFVSDMVDRDYKEFQNEEDIQGNLDGYLEQYLNKLSYSEKSELRSYTGLSFRQINSILRGSWNYDINGALTPEIKEESNRQADIIRGIIMKNDSLPMDMKVYRGVSLSSFRKYGVDNLGDLYNLKDNFIYEEGFTSTSLLREDSFFYKKTEWGEKANIEIEMLIPNESDDGVLLNASELSYSPNQNEFLINSGSLFKVIDIIVDNDKKTAKLLMALVPQKVWNPYDYEMERRTKGLL